MKSINKYFSTTIFLVAGTLSSINAAPRKTELEKLAAGIYDPAVEQVVLAAIATPNTPMTLRNGKQLPGLRVERRGAELDIMVEDSSAIEESYASMAPLRISKFAFSSPSAAADADFMPVAGQQQASMDVDVVETAPAVAEQPTIVNRIVQVLKNIGSTLKSAGIALVNIVYKKS
jgi:hypothetical protein